MQVMAKKMIKLLHLQRKWWMKELQMMIT